MMDSTKDDTQSNRGTISPSVTFKLEHESNMELNNYGTKCVIKPDASSLARDSYVSSYLSLSPITSKRKKGKCEKIVQFENESQEKRATRLARMAARAAERIAAESLQQRKERLTKMSEYKAKRLANENLAERLARLKKMSIYTASRIAQETQEQRAIRLSRMAQYSAKKIASENEEQRNIRLLKMAAYSARRRAVKKAAESDKLLLCQLD